MDINTVEIHQEFLVLLLLKNTVDNHVHNRIKNYQYHLKTNSIKNKLITKKSPTNFDSETSEYGSS
jgi:hypothetical protein